MSTDENLNELNCIQCPTKPPPKTCKCLPECKSCDLLKEEKCVYVQPPVPKCYRPKVINQLLKAKIVDKSVYREDYGVGKTEYLKPIKPKTCLSVSSGKFTNETTNNTTYNGFETLETRLPIFPKNNKFLGRGSMETLTTQKRDFVTQPYEKTKSMRPPRIPFSSDLPFDGQTLHRLSYTDNVLNANKPEPCRPDKSVTRMRGKMDTKSNTQISYPPWHLPSVEDRPSRIKSFILPTGPMSSNSEYRKSYPPQPCEIPKAFRPKNSCILSKEKMPGSSVYSNDFVFFKEEPKVNSLKQGCSINLGEGKMLGESMHRTAYQNFSDVPRVPPIIPAPSTIVESKFMQFVTANKEDYNQKPIQVRDAIRPVPSFAKSDMPMSRSTTANATYVPHDVDKAMVQPIRISKALSDPVGKMEDKSIHKLSYTIQEIPKPEVKPWSVKRQYALPEVPFEGQTVNSLIYKTPGIFIGCKERHLENTSMKPCCPSCCLSNFKTN